MSLLKKPVAISATVEADMPNIQCQDEVEGMVAATHDTPTQGNIAFYRKMAESQNWGMTPHS